MRKGARGVFLAAALALSIGNAAAVPYSFTNIADNSGAFSFFGTDPLIRPISPSLNNSGTVAFVATLDTRKQGVFTGSGGPTATLYDSNGPLRNFDAPSLNDSGTVAFFAFLKSGGFGIFTGSGGPTITIADTRSFGGLSATSSLNNSGTVAFNGVETAGVFVLTGSGGPTRTIAKITSIGPPPLSTTAVRWRSSTPSRARAWASSPAVAGLPRRSRIPPGHSGFLAFSLSTTAAQWRSRPSWTRANKASSPEAAGLPRSLRTPVDHSAGL